ncbi:YbaB/EbfC DNA-binding family protein [Saccharopolyspora kobensis]|uniref:YbaB/EbfC DNA-binding family protein n=1 Tax=Saccharopolyspora kobensis TaxID=146035 RepID=A0A1H6C0F0_9PSEU|nr:YbaB/EbfC family nucleoid-associated protein [Saccharopolyspora kobensis]SEG66207.1 YbaB/EbfC DNA-binding family protein [Saccharopolyspora kobensis]SFC22349.1 YbaB/EbfC DNA-binding family protein [Saccharopolyspora kobensis]
MINQDPLKAADELEKWAQGLEQRAQQYTELQDRLNATTARASSPDGAVAVTVDSNGVPTELRLNEQTRGMDPARVSELLMTCMRQAQAQLRSKVTELVQSTVPGEDAPALNIIAQYESRFPAAEPADPKPVGDDDEDWGDQSFMR